MTGFANAFCIVKNRVVLIPLVLVAVTMLLIYSAFRTNIKLRLWHLWNGDTVRLQNYIVPVPGDWIADQSFEGAVNLVEIKADRQRGLPLPHIGIVIGPAPEDLTAITSGLSELLVSNGSQVYEVRTIDFDSQKAECVVSDSFMKMASEHGVSFKDGRWISIDCHSTAGLSMLFNGDEKFVETFYSIVLQIRREYFARGA